jgi:hypothetical protein
MTPPHDILNDLRAAGITLELDPAGLKVRAPRLLLTPFRRALIEGHRDELLAVIVAEKDPPVQRETTWRIRAKDVAELAARTDRAAILATMTRLEARAAELNANPMYERILGYQRQLLAAIDAEAQGGSAA